MPDTFGGKVFINYRRGEDSGVAGRLYDWLEQEFSNDGLFMDVDTVAPGADFVSVLEDWVMKCDVLLAVIGKTWLDLKDTNGGRRLDNPNDFVRIEIASALQQGKRVIPVLVNGADMPAADKLPEPLKTLARRNAVRLTHERFKADVHGLVSGIKVFLAEAETERASSTEAERKAAEEARRAREAEEEARAARLDSEKAASLQAGLTPNEIRRAEELANWDFVKDRHNTADLRDHLARFVGGATERYARTKLEALVWADPATQTSIEGLRAFLDEFPKTENAEVAKARLEALERETDAAWQADAHSRAEAEAWAKVARTGDVAELKSFLKTWPSGRHAAAASARIGILGAQLNADSRPVQATVYIIGAGIVWLYFFIAFTWLSWVVLAFLALLVFVPGAPIWRLLHDQSVSTFEGHAGSVYSVTFFPNGSAALSGGDDRTLNLWARGTVQRIFMGHTGSITSVSVSADGNTALSGGWDNTLILWDVNTGGALRTFTGHTSIVTSVVFSPDGRTALSGSRDNTLKLWDVATGKELNTFTGHNSRVQSVAISPDGRTATSASDDGTLKLWDLATGKGLRTFTGHNSPVQSVALSPDGRLALSASDDGTLKLWDLATGKDLRTFNGHTDRVELVAVSKDGRTALSGSVGGTLKLWDIATGKEMHTFTGHTGAVHSVAVSPDGLIALSGSEDKTLKLWNLTRFLPDL